MGQHGGENAEVSAQQAAVVAKGQAQKGIVLAVHPNGKQAQRFNRQKREQRAAAPAAQQ